MALAAANDARSMLGPLQADVLRLSVSVEVADAAQTLQPLAPPPMDNTDGCSTTTTKTNQLTHVG